MLNDVVGYGSQGFSYTENYKESIYYLVKCIELINESEFMKYKDFQNKIYAIKKQESMPKIQETPEKEGSEIRMILKPLVKFGLINSDNYLLDKNGDLDSIKISKSFFSELGKQFILTIKIEHKIKDLGLDTSIIEKIQARFCIFQIFNLFENESCVYKDMFVFLLKYKHMDKNEFYIMATLRNQNKMNELDSLISEYRADKHELTITKNPNDYQTYHKQLMQYNLVQYKDESNKVIELTNDFYKYFEV